MSDREMLELAAKAANLQTWTNEDGGLYLPDPMRRWNPLADDGDALRLLAAMPSLWSLSLKFGAPTVEMNVWWGTGGEKTNKIAREFAGDGADVAAAIRRAIVRAAADVGRDVS
jgi:hypothetical protein